MNILFHLYLSADDEELLIGNFMGDFVKGRIDNTYPPAIRQGLLLHRKIDAFAENDEHFQRSRARLAPEFGLYRGVLVDLFYDHFLASEWSAWSDLSYVEYLTRTRRIVEKYLLIMPPHLQDFVPIIFNELLPSYQKISGTEAALRRMGRRIKRENPLAAGGAELTRHYPELQSDFARFTPAVQRFVAEFLVGTQGRD